MINLNEAQEQGSGLGTIPPNSIVPVIYIMEAPEQGRQGTYPELCKSKESNLEYVRGYFEVADGSFKGKKIYHNFNVLNANTAGQKKAVDISLATIRAMIEAHNQISPKNTSERACSLRVLQSWGQLHGLRCFIKVKCEKATSNKSGESFIVNALYSVITVDDKNYQALCTQMEMITDEAIPQASTAPQAKQNNSVGQGWGQAPQAPQQSQSPAPSPAPGWATGGSPNGQAWGQSSNSVPPPPPAYGNNDLGPAFPAPEPGIDQIPF